MHFSSNETVSCMGTAISKLVHIKQEKVVVRKKVKRQTHLLGKIVAKYFINRFKLTHGMII